MKRSPHLVLLSIMILMMLFLFPPNMGITSAAQAKQKAASPSNVWIASSSDAAIIISDIEIDKYSINCVQLLQRGISSASLPIHLNEKINFYREGEGFPEKNVHFTIHFETEDFDQTYGNQTGLFFLTASVELTDSCYELAPEVSADFQIPVFLYDPDHPSFLPPLNSELNNYDGMEAFHLVTDVHTDLQQIADMLIQDYPYENFYLYFDNGYYLILPNEWDMSAVKADTPGIYTACRRPALPQGVLLEDIPETPCSINIQDSKVFTLSSPKSFGNNLVTAWLYPTPDRSLFRAWYRIGEGDWTEDTKEYLMCLVHGGHSYSLYLNPWEMLGDIHYQFRLEYDGVYSGVLEIGINEDGFYIPNEGDRDGADRDGQDPPDVVLPPPGTSVSVGSGSQKEYGPGFQNQSAPEPLDATPPESDPIERSEAGSTAAVSVQPAASEPELLVDSEAADLMEEDTKDRAAWSGTRIQNYLETFPGLPILFEKHNICLSIPADSPALVPISDTDFLQVTIQNPSSDTVSLMVTLNDVPLTGLIMTVTMPWTGELLQGMIQIKNESGELIGDADYSDQENCITFTVTQSGIYRIILSASEETQEIAAFRKMQDDILPSNDRSSAETEAPSESTSKSILAISIIFAIPAIGGAGFIARRRHKRKED